MELFLLVLFFICIAGILSVFLLYPLLVFSLAMLFPKIHEESISGKAFKISILLAFYGDLTLLKEKIRNFLSLNYPKENLEMIVCFDGPMPEESQLTFATGIQNLRITSLEERKGKTFALNKAATYAEGDLLLFTDADAIFTPDCLYKLSRHFSDPQIGGVFSKRMILEEGDEIVAAQKFYIDFDSFIKINESVFGSTTSNDGKLYIIRREYFEPIAPMTTDDLYCSLRIIRKGKRFIFDPDVPVYIRKPSRSLRHEFQRRIRIVSQSMVSLWLNKDLFNPLRFGFFSVGLFINKVMRRFVGVFLLFLLVSSSYLSFCNRYFFYFTALQFCFYLAPLAGPVIEIFGLRNRFLNILAKLSKMILYFLTGCAGSVVGIFVFLSGKSPARWEPLKG